MRRICILAVALASLAVAAPAGAQVVMVPLSFNWAVLTTPGLKDVPLVTPKTNPITATASFDTSTGAFTIQPANFSFPTYSFTTPVPGSLQISLNGPASGQFNPATGAVSMTADYLATINLTGIGTCTADGGSQTYSTSNTTVFPGVAFPATATGAGTGPGALSGGWPSVTTTGNACGLVARDVNGAGGLWISKNVSPPALSVAAPKNATAKVGKTTTIKVTVKDAGNFGETDVLGATGVSVCVTAPRSAHVTAAKCKTIGTLAGNAKKTLKFKFNGTAPGKFVLKFTAKGSDVTTVSKTVTVKVKS
jgi:hypothetical protein